MSFSWPICLGTAALTRLEFISRKAMQNKKETLIDVLRGSTKQLKDIHSLVSDVDIYDENGYVDTSFFTQVLVSVNEFMDASNLLVQALTSKLAPNTVPADLKEKQETGSKWSVEEILKHCTLEGDVMKLPAVQFNKKSYAEAKKWIEEAGGSWQGGKVQGFVFPFNPQRVFSILHEGKRCNLQQEFQFFETPDAVADWLVMNAGGITSGATVLEPSAGRGAIVRAILRTCPDAVVDCYELMPENRQFLSSLERVNLRGHDFIKEAEGTWSYIFANPPFSGNQDIDHVMHMYNHLAPGGVLAAIMSPHWKIASEKKCESFRQFLLSIDAKVLDINPGEFKSSGTSIATTAVFIKK